MSRSGAAGGRNPGERRRDHDGHGQSPRPAGHRPGTDVDPRLPRTPEQVGQARRLLALALEGCPVADDAVLCLSELAGNSVLHSRSRRPGGTFTVRAEMRDGDYVRVEVRDEGGPWNNHPGADGRPHGLAIVRAIAADSGTDGDVLTGWIGWARIDWP